MRAGGTVSAARRRWIAVAAAVAALTAACSTGGGATEPRVARPTAAVPALPACPPPAAAAAQDGGRRLPDLTLPCLGPGDAVPLRRLTGSPLVVNLWASWCAPCREELPAFARLHRAAGGRVRVIGVASQDRVAAARAYAGDNVPFPSVLDEDGDVARALGRRGLPLTVFLSPDGRIVDLYQGAPLTDATLRRLVRERLGVDVG